MFDLLHNTFTHLKKNLLLRLKKISTKKCEIYSTVCSPSQDPNFWGRGSHFPEWCHIHRVWHWIADHVSPAFPPCRMLKRIRRPPSELLRCTMWRSRALVLDSSLVLDCGLFFLLINVHKKLKLISFIVYIRYRIFPLKKYKKKFKKIHVF